MVAHERGAGASSDVQLLRIPGQVVRGCGKCDQSGQVFPIPDGDDYGTVLGGVTGRYKVGGQLACRMDQRAFSAAIALSRKIPVRAIDQVLKRAGVGAARVCTDTPELIT